MQWIACGEYQMPPGLDWISPRERARVDRLTFTKRRTEYLLRRYAGKRGVAATLGLDVDPQRLSRIELLNRPSGAPYVVVDGREGDLDVSLTDRAGSAVCLTGPGGALASGTVGADLEIVEKRSEYFVNDYFTLPEQAYIHAQRDAAGQDGWDASANLLWSAKEAGLKVLRVGLKADTRILTVHVSHEVRADGWAPMEIEVIDGSTFTGWWRRDGIFLLTIAYRYGGPPPDLLPGGADLATSQAVHSWLANPTLR
ncbi:MAG: 4'-phosphopantetheinyl transferase superfamily protein [Austwickia sp.]|jgi:4'-phosphopantetheinyl transferase|nr:4'-phosphopantetheinyl transferase superfamily protein [Austwickia sp.]